MLLLVAYFGTGKLFEIPCEATATSCMSIIGDMGFQIDLENGNTFLIAVFILQLLVILLFPMFVSSLMFLVTNSKLYLS